MFCLHLLLLGLFALTVGHNGLIYSFCLCLHRYIIGFKGFLLRLFRQEPGFVGHVFGVVGQHFLLQDFQRFLVGNFSLLLCCISLPDGHQGEAAQNKEDHRGYGQNEIPSSVPFRLNGPLALLDKSALAGIQKQLIDIRREVQGIIFSKQYASFLIFGKATQQKLPDFEQFLFAQADLLKDFSGKGIVP